MKSIFKSTLMACSALFIAGFTSCTDDALVEASQKYAGKFELTVTQANPESRLELGQDGLTTQWEPGDKLVLVDKTRTLAPIFLNCTLKEKSSTATFVAESGVPAGDYYVIYNYNENLAYGHKSFQSVSKINEDDDLVLWNELRVVEGEDNASISLNHLYTKIRVELKNIPNVGMAMDGGFTVGMYSSKKGFPVFKQFTSSGLVDAEYGYNPNSMNNYMSNPYFPSDRKYHNIRFGYYSPEYVYDDEMDPAAGGSYDYSKATELSALVLPSDLTGETMYFYVLKSDGMNYSCYEFKKEGVEFKAGTSYKVVLDMDQATVSTLNCSNSGAVSTYQLTNAADWRHAAYKNSTWENYELTQNIDFEGEDFFPISARFLKGEGYTLSNIELNWADEDNVGLIRHEWEGENDNCVQPIEVFTSVSDLTLENVTFKGKNYVGAFGGWNISANKCEVIGTSVIEAKGNNVGGIVGFNKLTDYFGDEMVVRGAKLVDIRVGQTCSVSGKNYVGGIVGRYATQHDYLGQCSSSMTLIESSKFEGTVRATEDYVGGIFGKVGGSISNSNTNTNIEFTMEDFTFSLVKCMNEGTVTGRHYVGGIGGDFAVSSYSYVSTLDRVVLSQSYSTGNVSGDTKVGGILGTTMAATNICYSTGEISATTSSVGGIVGEISIGGSQARIANCYSLATISGTTTNIGGIIGNAGGGAMGATVVNSYYAADPNTYSFGGIVGNSGGSVSVINCLTTLNSLGTNLGNHLISTGADYNNDGYPDYDYNGDGVWDSNDLYMNMPDNLTGSVAAVTSILANIAVINGDNAYSSNIWPITTYPWECVKFASFSADTDAPGFDDETIQ